MATLDPYFGSFCDPVGQGFERESSESASDSLSFENSISAVDAYLAAKDDQLGFDPSVFISKDGYPSPQSPLGTSTAPFGWPDSAIPDFTFTQPLFDPVPNSTASQIPPIESYMFLDPIPGTASPSSASASHQPSSDGQPSPPSSAEDIAVQDLSKTFKTNITEDKFRLVERDTRQTSVEAIANAGLGGRRIFKGNFVTALDFLCTCLL
jgi:hypothetical protein